MSFIPSNEQELSVRSILGNENIKIIAFSGTGKTTTLELIANTFKSKKILYLCFNKAIQEVASKRFGNNVKASTIHSLAMSAVRKYRPNVDLQLRNYKESGIAKLFNTDYKTAKEALLIFNGFCISDSSEISISSSSTEGKKFAKEMYERMECGKMPSSHNFYLKLYEQLLIKKVIPMGEYSIALLDEAQDANPIQLSVFNNINTYRRVYVGDRHQQIYSFMNSVNSMDKVDGLDVYLTQTFRLNVEVAALASDLLARFKNERIRIKSNKAVATDIEVNEVAYISRTNAALIKKMCILNEAGFFYKTIRDPNLILSLAVDIWYFSQNEFHLITTNHHLNDHKNIEALYEYAEEVEDNEILRTIELVIEYKEKIIELRDTAILYFEDNTQRERNIYLTTAHSSKGLEWQKVVLDNDFPTAAELIAKAEFTCLQDYKDCIESVSSGVLDEFNLLYVALTRAKELLEHENCEAIKYINMKENELDFKIRKAYEKNMQQKSK